MDVLRRIAGDRPLGLISIQGLHRFYSRGGDVVASWMTKEDREHAIADNVDYVGNVLTAVADESGITRPLIYIGFSQGVAMAFRTAALVQRPCDGLIAAGERCPSRRGAACRVTAEECCMAAAPRTSSIRPTRRRRISRCSAPPASASSSTCSRAAISGRRHLLRTMRGIHR